MNKVLYAHVREAHLRDLLARYEQAEADLAAYQVDILPVATDSGLAGALFGSRASIGGVRRINLNNVSSLE